MPSEFGAVSRRSSASWSIGTRPSSPTSLFGLSSSSPPGPLRVIVWSMNCPQTNDHGVTPFAETSAWFESLNTRFDRYRSTGRSGSTVLTPSA
jgi:hypothetical protein